MKNYGGPICSLCSRDWDERLGYCERCESASDRFGAADESSDRRYTPGGGLLEDNFS